MLHAAGQHVPTKIAIHGHLTVNGEKMSKSRGTFINAAIFAKHLDPQYLRYYFATKLGPAPEDLDLSFEDFKARIDGELVNKLANLFSAAAPILSRLDNQARRFGDGCRAAAARMPKSADDGNRRGL